MKANLKGQGGIAGLLLLHGEKLGIAVVLIGAVYLGISASGIDRLPGTRQADKLQEKVRTTRASVEDPANNWTSAVDEHRDLVRVADELIRANAMTVSPEAYAISGRGFDPPVITQSAPRTDPILLAAADVIARGGVGLIPFVDAEAARKAELAERLRQQEEAARMDQERIRQERDQEAATGRGRRGRGTRPRGRGAEQESRRGGDYERTAPGRRMVGGRGSRGGAQLQGGELVQLTHWAVVVAKVPIKDQRGRYIDAFQDARGGYNERFDFPNYLGFLVQRAEVRRGQEKLDWQPIAVYDPKGAPSGKKVGDAMSDGTRRALDMTMRDWAVGSEIEVVDLRYLDLGNVLTYPLPPLVGRAWGAEATHPDIPLASDARAEELAFEAFEEQVLPATPVVGGDRFGFGSPNQTYGPGVGRATGRENYRDYTGGRREMGGRGYDAYEGASGMRRGGQATLARGVNDWLLRFFDFTVEPGKKYKYQVRLVLDDPNLAPHVLPKDLDPSVQARIKELPKGPDGRPTVSSRFRFAPWSEPSPTVSIPLSGSVRLAENAKASSGNMLGDDPQVKLLVESFAKDGRSDNWIQAAKEKEFSRGSVANFVDDADALVDGEFVEEVKSFEFFSGVTVLDVRGGERLGRDLIVPSRVLVMDPAGQLSVRQELDDALDVLTHRQTFAEPDDVRTFGGTR